MSQPPPQGGVIDDGQEAVNQLIERAAEPEDRFQAAFISLLEGNAERYAERYASMPSRRSAGEGDATAELDGLRAELATLRADIARLSENSPAYG
ncbi:hypothetical protein ACFRMN_05910 [Streptomyces sp. NPDC056835]|uniref:hypothetical protein n=1 Tax=Streptomyces sp. NPDC056835 TaxID=3345956 RepID=UPI003681C2EA